jgi:ABC-type oligopeptide transport system ATPase subunit
MDTLLEVRNLETHFDTPEGVVYAVNGISFAVKEGEALGVIASIADCVNVMYGGYREKCII